MSQAGLINIKGGGGTGAILTLTPDIGGPVSATGNNINVLSAATDTGTTVNVGGSTINFNSYTPANWVVDPVLYKGTHQTITAASAATSPGDIVFIREGTYIENFIAATGVTYVALSMFNVIIKGNITFSNAGSSAFIGIQFVNNGGNTLTFSGNSILNVNLYSCLFSLTSNIGISNGNTNSNTSCYIANCELTNSSAQFLNSNLGTFHFYGCVENSTITPIASSITGGGLIIQDSYFLSPWAVSTNSNYTDSYFDSSSLGVTPLQFTGAFIEVLNQCKALGGTAPGMSIGAGNQVSATNLTIDSNNTNAISGSGGIQYSDISFSNSSSTIQTTITQSFFGFLAGNTQLSGGLIVSTTIPGSYPYTTLSKDHIILASSSAAHGITLISSPKTGQFYSIKDATGTAATHNITITPASGNIDGAATYIISTNYGSVDLVYSGTQWNAL